MTNLELYLQGTTIETFVDNKPYLLNISNKNNREKLIGILACLAPKINYIGFDDWNIDCWVVSIHDNYNLILKNHKEQWSLLSFIFGSMTEITDRINYEELCLQYPHRIKDSIGIHEHCSHFMVR